MNARDGWYRDRDGDLYPVPPEPTEESASVESEERLDGQQEPAEHACRDGWLGEDAAGIPVPCLVCKPHIADRRRRLRDRMHGGPDE